MTTNAESPNINKTDTDLIDKITSVVEKTSLILLVVPFGSIVLWIFTDIFLEARYFFFFPTALFLFFPTGFFALLIQLFRITRKRPINPFNGLMLGFSIITVFIGILACMLLYVAVG
jgi:hypothetical protein